MFSGRGVGLTHVLLPSATIDLFSKFQWQNKELVRGVMVNGPLEESRAEQENCPTWWGPT